MSDEKKSNESDPKDKRNSEFRVPPRTWILWIAILGSIPLLIVLRDKVDTGGQRLTQNEFFEKFASNQIASAHINYIPQVQIQEIVGKYHRVETDGKKVEVPFKAKVRLYPELEKQLMESGKFDPQEPNTLLMSFVYQLVFIVLIGALIWFFFIRQIKMAGKGALSFGKS